MNRSAPRSIDQYLRELKSALGDADPALIQDALYDAEEYLRAVEHRQQHERHQASAQFFLELARERVGIRAVLAGQDVLIVLGHSRSSHVLSS